MAEDQQPSLAELADDPAARAAWEAWLAAHPRDAAEVEATRQMRALLQQLRSLAVDVPDDLEARVLSKVHRANAVRELLNLNLSGSARVLVELMTVLFSLFPASAPEETRSPRSI